MSPGFVPRCPEFERRDGSGREPVDAVFEGGGIRGIALAGAAAGAMELGFRFERVAGTSAGALVASLVAAGYQPAELAETVCSIDWPALLDPVPLLRLPLVGKHLALALWGGLYRGDRLEGTWAELLATKGVESFGDLPPGALRMLATDLTHQQGVVLPDGLARYGFDPDRFRVAKAVRMSASVPFWFRSVEIRHGPEERVSFADGALASIFPVGLLHGSPRPLLGFRLLARDDRHPHDPIRGPGSLARAVVGAGIRARESLPSYSTHPARLVDIPADRNPLDFRLDRTEAREMFEGGRAAAVTALSGWAPLRVGP